MRIYLSGEGATAPPEIVLGDRCNLMISHAFVISNHKANKPGQPVKPDKRFRAVLNSRRKRAARKHQNPE